MCAPQRNRTPLNRPFLTCTPYTNQCYLSEFVRLISNQSGFLSLQTLTLSHRIFALFGSPAGYLFLIWAGASGEVRTLDPVIKSHVLYQLSYGSRYKQKLLLVNNCIIGASVKGVNDIATYIKPIL